MLIFNYSINKPIIKNTHKNKLVIVTNYSAMNDFIDSFSDSDIISIIDYITKKDIDDVDILIHSRTRIENIKFIKNRSIIHRIKIRYDRLKESKYAKL